MNPATTIPETTAQQSTSIDTTYNSVTSDTSINGTVEDSADINDNQSEQSPSSGATSQAIPAIDEEKAFELLQMCEAAIASAFYMSNAKRVARLEEAMNIPVSDDKAFQMFYSNAEKDLESEGNKIARKNKTVPAEITKTEIIARAQNRYVEKYGKQAIINEEYAA